MLKIGFDKTDPNYQKFFFDDDTVLTSNPPKYKVWYMDDNGDIDYSNVDYVVCSNVFYLKPATIQLPQKQQPKIEHVQPQKVEGTLTSTEPISESTIKIPEQPKTTIDLNEVEIIPQKKKRGRPKKETKTSESTTHVLPSGICVGHVDYKLEHPEYKYEYKVIEESFFNDEDIEKILNEYGEERWELCGFEIYKTGLIQSNRIIMILKRRK